jgi:hypothetical protein
MKRMHVIEIADLAWCPPGIRHGVSDTVRIIKWLPIPLTYVIGVPSEKAAEPVARQDRGGRSHMARQ